MFGKRRSVSGDNPGTAERTVYRPVAPGPQRAPAPPPRAVQRPATTADPIAAKMPPSIMTHVGFNPEIDREKAATVGMALFTLIGKATSDEDDDCHFGTFMARLAALTGEFALRSGAAATRTPLPTRGNYAVGGSADPYLFGAGQNDFHILELLVSAAADGGAQPSCPPNLLAILAKTAAAIRDRSEFPPHPTVGDDCLPQDWPPNAGPLFRADVIHTAGKFDFTEPEEITLALGYAMVALLFVAKDNDQDLMELIVLAAEIMIPVSRMGPLDRVY